MKSPRLLNIVGGVVLFVVVAAAGWEMGARVGSSSDRAGIAACQRFRSLAADIRLMTPAEQRGALQAVYDKARDADTETVRAWGRAILEAATSGDVAAQTAAIKHLDAACESIGA